MFGFKRSNKSSKRTNRKSRRTSKRRSSRRQRGGQSDYASAYGSAAPDAQPREEFAGMLTGAEGFKGHEEEQTAPAGPPAGGPPGPAPVKGGAGKPNTVGGRRRRGVKGRKNFGTGEMTAASLALANFYGPGAKSRRNRRKSRRNRSQRRK
jgi:hypothetical protein